MSVWSCHILKNLPWRWATSDNTPTVSSNHKLKRTAITKQRTNGMNQRWIRNMKHIFCFGGGKKSYIILYPIWRDKIPDLLFQKVFGGVFLVVWMFIIKICTRQQDLAVFQRNLKSNKRKRYKINLTLNENTYISRCEIWIANRMETKTSHTNKMTPQAKIKVTRGLHYKVAF